MNPLAEYNQFFLGVQTADGYISCSEDLQQKADRVLILKGAPGTGKSRIMREIASAGEQRGESVERYLCSSDPLSLDGVYVTERKIAVLDGTAPHICEPTCPGARDEIVSLGDFWDSEMLRTKRNDILLLSEKKKAGFTGAARFMDAIRQIQAEKEGYLSEAVKTEKMKGAVSRLLHRLPDHGSPSGHTVLTRQIEAVGMEGAVFLPTYERLAETVILVSDTHGIGWMVWEEILRQLTLCQIPCYISRSPFGGRHVHALFLPESKTAILPCLSEKEPDGILNTERFLNKDAYRQNRNKLRALSALEAELHEEIEKKFKEIRFCHFALEAIYGEAMDFQKKEEETRRLLRDLFPET